MGAGISVEFLDMRHELRQTERRYAGTVRKALKAYIRLARVVFIRIFSPIEPEGSISQRGLSEVCNERCVPLSTPV